MASLLELVRARREELEQAQPELRITDEQRIWAFLALQERAAEAILMPHAAWSAYARFLLR
jgi:hypothetical protein